MSPQNCLAILSPFSIGSSPRRRRSDEGRGVKGESERDTSDACSALDIRGAGKCGGKMRARGERGLAHGNRGKPARNKIASEKIKKVIALARGRYQGLNDTHLTEKLKEKEEINLSRPTVRGILRQAGIAAVKKRGVKRHYKRRERKAQAGALVLWDGSPHRWFGEKPGEWSLMAVIDDATGALLCGVFAL